MKRLVSGLLSLAVALSFVQADCEAVTPPEQKCPTHADSVTYEASGSCGASGVVTILVPTPGKCDISVVENQSIHLPATGGFTPSAAATNYDLAKGGWTLSPTPSGTLGDNAGLNCSISSLSPTEIGLDCDITACTIVGDNDEPSCAVSGMCAVHLTPAPPGAMPDLDAGLGTDAEDASDGEVDSSRDAED